MKRTGPTTRAQSKNMTKHEYEKLKNEQDIEFESIRNETDNNESKKSSPEVKITGVNNKKRIIKKSKQSDSDIIHQISSTSELSDNEDGDELIKSKSNRQYHQQNIKKDLSNISLLMFLYFLQGK
jgi:hypothetical protein